MSDIEKILEEFREVINKANDEAPGQIRALLKRYVKHYEEKEELRAKDSEERRDKSIRFVGFI